jgi:hypothetical protein
MTLQEHMERHKDRFLTYSIEEIRDDALLHGFDREQVEQWFSASNFERRKVA